MYKLLNLKPYSQRQSSGYSGSTGLAHLSESLTAVIVAISLEPQLKTCFLATLVALSQ